MSSSVFLTEPGIDLAELSGQQAPAQLTVYACAIVNSFFMDTEPNSVFYQLAHLLSPLFLPGLLRQGLTV